MANESKKNLVEEALLQMKNLEEAVSENAKGILASTMKEEISELVKESLTEEETEEMTETETSEMKDEMSEQEEDDIEMDIEDDEDEMDIEMDDMDSDEELDIEDEDEEDFDMDDMLMMDLPGDELEVDDEEEVLLPLDLTTASDEEILKVFKAMGDEDGIIVKKDNDEIHLSDTEEDVEYIIQTESKHKKMKHMEEMKDMDEMMEMEDMDEVVYELEIDEMYEEDEEVEEMYESEVEEGYDESNEGYKEETKEASKYGKGMGNIPSRDRAHKQKGHGRGPRNKETDKEEGIKMDYTETYEAETTEAARTYGNGERNYPKRKSLPKMKVVPNKSLKESELKSEVESLRAKNEEYRKALNIFREKLNEVAVFNSNLAYATRLFTEHSTTKQEKINILRRFDSVESLKESKTLYKTLKEEFTGKDNTITESVQSKVQKTPSKGSATNLIESKTYENPQFMRMKDLMTKITK
jgi:hypothetical protein